MKITKQEANAIIKELDRLTLGNCSLELLTAYTKLFQIGTDNTVSFYVPNANYHNSGFNTGMKATIE